VPRLAINVLNCLERPVVVREAKLTWTPSAGGQDASALVMFDSRARTEPGEQWTSGLMSAPAGGAGALETVVTIEESDGTVRLEHANPFHVRGVFTTVED
jgi:hypothetical protein